MAGFLPPLTSHEGQTVCPRVVSKQRRPSAKLILWRKKTRIKTKQNVYQYRAYSQPYSNRLHHLTPADLYIPEQFQPYSEAYRISETFQASRLTLTLLHDFSLCIPDAPFKQWWSEDIGVNRVSYIPKRTKKRPGWGTNKALIIGVFDPERGYTEKQNKVYSWSIIKMSLFCHTELKSICGS